MFTLKTSKQPRSVVGFSLNNKINPFIPLNEIAEFFDDEFVKTNFLQKNDLPATNVSVSETETKIEVALPGLQKKDVNIFVEDGILTISKEERDEKIEEKKNFIRKEFSFNSFKRSFELEDNIDIDNISSKFEDGLLKIVLPKIKTEKQNKKLIEIE